MLTLLANHLYFQVTIEERLNNTEVVILMIIRKLKNMFNVLV